MFHNKILQLENLPVPAEHSTTWSNAGDGGKSVGQISPLRPAGTWEVHDIMTHSVRVGEPDTLSLIGRYGVGRRDRAGEVVDAALVVWAEPGASALSLVGLVTRRLTLVEEILQAG